MLDEAKTMKDLQAVWNNISVGIRHGYTEAKDAAKKRIKEGE